MASISEVTKARMPGMSESRISWPSLPVSRPESTGRHFVDHDQGQQSEGTLIANSACQPTKLTNNPPTTGPTAAAEVFAIWIRPSGRVDGTFASRAQFGDHHDGGRVRRRCPQRHERAGHADQREVGRERCDGAGDRHQRHAEHEQAARAEAVSEPAHQRLARGGGEVEGGDHPGDRGDVEPEMLPQDHQRDGDHGRVQRIQRRAEAQAGHGEAVRGLLLTETVCPTSAREAELGYGRA